MNITNYETLLLAAKEQDQPQRLLFVFLKTSLPKNHKDDESERFHAGDGGALEPIMCVDKTLDELSNFADLVTESEKINGDWQIVLIASLGGQNGAVPSSDDATEPLKMMVQTVETGGNLSQFLAFDKDGQPIQFS